MQSSTRSEIQRELRIWLTLAGPSSLRGLLDLGPWIIVLAFIGRVGTKELAALSLFETFMYGFMSINWVAVSMTQSTLVSQAHGARSLSGVHGWRNLSFLSSLALTCVVTALWVLSKTILDAAGFDPVLVSAGYTYALWCIPNLWLEGFNQVAVTYAQSLQIALLPLLMSAVTCAVDCVVSYALIFGMGTYVNKMSDPFQASAIGWTCGGVASLLQYAALLLWIRGREFDFDKREEAAPSLKASFVLEASESKSESKSESALSPLLSSDGEAPEASQSPPSESPSPDLAWVTSMKRWKTFGGQLGMNMISIASLTLQYMLISFLAAALGTVQLATHNTMMCLFEVVHSAATGMAEATAVRVGYHLGRGDARAAKLAGACAIGAAALWGAAVSVMGWVLRSHLGRLFTNDQLVLSACAELAPFMWFGYALLCVGDQALAVLEGQGRATLQGALYIASAWGIGFPSAFLSWKYSSWGLRGLWGSLLGGYFVLDVVALGVLWGSDWERIAQKVQATQASDADGE
jgi:Na+-driven multidrug efflux pump